jgi:hypothetical protein
MRIKETKVFTFDELSDSAKEKARDWYRQSPLDSQDAWDQIREDAENIGLRITTLDDSRPNEGNFIDTAVSTIDKITANHGQSCETYQTAKRYEINLKVLLKTFDDSLEAENAYGDCAHEFLHDLLEDYRVMLNKEIEYRYSNETVDESILANEYEFTIDGKRS